MGFLLQMMSLLFVFLEYHLATGWSPPVARDIHPCPYDGNGRRQSQGLGLPAVIRPSRSARLRRLGAMSPSNLDDSDNEASEVISIESLTYSQLVELIELSFLQACVTMAKTGDINPLKLFIVTVKAAKESENRHGNIRELIEAVDKCPSQQLGRPLDPSERELRAIWIQVIYLMIWRIEYGKNNSNEEPVGKRTETITDLGIDETVADLYSPVLDDLVAIHKSGLGLNIDRFVASRKAILMPANHNRQGNPLLIDDDSDDGGPIQLAIVTQTIKVLYNTLEVLDESRQDKTDTAAEKNDSKRQKKSAKKGKSSGGIGFG